MLPSPAQQVVVVAVGVVVVAIVAVVVVAVAVVVVVVAAAAVLLQQYHDGMLQQEVQYWHLKKPQIPGKSRHVVFKLLLIPKVTVWAFPKIGVPQNGWFIVEKTH